MDQSENSSINTYGSRYRFKITLAWIESMRIIYSVAKEIEMSKRHY